MSVNSTQNSNTTVKFAGDGTQIKLSEIQSFFGGNSNDIKLGKYYRKTSTSIPTGEFGQESSGHFVPDATENATIPTSGGISFDDFHGVSDNGIIKEYIIVQTGTNSKLNLANSDYWNSNLSKNIPKKAKLNGRMTSGTAPTTSDGSGYSHSDDSALRFSGEAYNLNIDVDSGVNSYTEPGSNGDNELGIFGAGGAGGTLDSPSGKAGGTAMFIQQNSNLSNESSIINVNTSNGRVFAGGGGGMAGRAGNAGDTAVCRMFRTSNSTVTNSGFTIRSVRSKCFNNAGDGCADSQTYTYNNFQSPQQPANLPFHVLLDGYPNTLYTGGWGGSACNGSGGRCRCRGGGRNRGCGSDSGCYNTIVKVCKYTVEYAGNTGNAGNGGTGGGGKGASNINTDGGWSQGGNGACPNCNPIYIGLASQTKLHVGQNNDNCGNDGTSGTVGGGYGSAGVTPGNNRSGNPGAAGHAIYSNTKSRVQVSNTNNNAGQMNNITT